ncbi:hypothetical protein RYX51_11165 [Priestia filamentosa]|nr:hypothetical protein RYX51_11165 [Priestia filamentosa]
MNDLFTPYKLKGLEMKNRIVMPPMCQYSVNAKDGIATDFHYLHYVSRAIGGAGFIIIEMTDVEPDGRISDFDLGLWSDDQIPALKRIVEACHKYPIGAGGRPGTHAGYQVPLAREIKKALNVPVIAVGRLDEPTLANAVIGNEEADLIAVGRGMLRNPYWALEASKKLNKETEIPKQYVDGFRR